MIEVKQDELQQGNTDEHQLFVLTQQFQYNLKQQYQKVLGFSPMFNNTCVILAIKSHRLQCVAHIDAQGNVLKQLTYQNSNFYPFAIISNRQIVWLHSDQNLILQWNVETYELLQFNFMFLNSEVSDSQQIFVFPETQLLCVAQWGNHNSNKFRLTYYHYPLTEGSSPVNQFESEEAWDYLHIVRRANTKSKLVWFKSTQKQYLQFKTYQLVQEGNGLSGNVTTHKVANPFLSGQKTTELSVGNIWQMSPYNYMIVSITDRPKQNGEYANSIFVYEEKNKLFREAKFSMDGKYRFQIVDYFSFGNTAMIKTFHFNQGNVEQTPVYFINNEKECIVARQSWKCSHLNKYTFPAYDSNSVVDAEYQNGNVTSINSKTVRVVAPKQIYTNWIMQIVDNPDQDLLDMVVQLL